MTHREPDDATPEPEENRDVIGWLPELRPEDVERVGHAAEVEYVEAVESARRSRWPAVAALVAAVLIVALVVAVVVWS